MYQKAVLTTLLVGKAVAFGRPGVRSAISKRPISEPTLVTEIGLVGDEQGDARHHGGPDKAIHHYALDHYRSWQRELPASHEVLNSPGAFGENFSTEGLTEDNVCVGDVFSIGSVLVEVSQARQPCWKLNVRFRREDMALRLQSTGRTGWYYRILQVGHVSPGDMICLVNRPHPKWPLSRLLRAFYVETLNLIELEQIAQLEVLPFRWRQIAERRLAAGAGEDWTQRLHGPVAVAAPAKSGAN